MYVHVSCMAEQTLFGYQLHRRRCSHRRRHHRCDESRIAGVKGGQAGGRQAKSVEKCDADEKCKMNKNVEKK